MGKLWTDSTPVDGEGDHRRRRAGRSSWCARRDSCGTWEQAVADLGRPGTLGAALEGVDAVVATANAIAPSSDSAAIADVGYAELVRRAERAGVMGLNLLIATSETDWDTDGTTARLGPTGRRTVEEILRAKAELPPIS